MSPKTPAKIVPAGKTGKSAPRKPKTEEQIKKELREQRALNPSKSEVEDYLLPPSRHFGF